MLLYLFLVCSVLSSLDYTSKEIADIKRTKLLTIASTSQSADYQIQQKCCFSIEVQDKNKPKGYKLIKKKFQTISNYLTNKVLIPKNKLFKPTNSQVRMNHNRRVWTFKQVVCFLTQNNKQQIETALQKQGGIKHINFKRVENLNQYDLITKAFHNAKQAANQFLSEIEYRIKRVESYDIINDINLEPESHESRNKASQYSSQSNQKQDDQSESDIQTQHVQIQTKLSLSLMILDKTMIKNKQVINYEDYYFNYYYFNIKIKNINILYFQFQITIKLQLIKLIEEFQRKNQNSYYNQYSLKIFNKQFNQKIKKN